MERPEKNYIELIISTPSRFVGEFENDYLLLTHLWPFFLNRTDFISSLNENPYCRNYYIVKYKIIDFNDEQDIYNKSEYIRESLLICLSILFGKRFDDHQYFTHIGFNYQPNYYNKSAVISYSMPYCNHRPRKDLGIELNFSNLKYIEKIIFNSDKLYENFKNRLMTAGKFYLSSLRLIDTHPDLAFLNLVNCGEVLSGFYDYSDSEIFNSKILDIFEKIESSVPKGKSYVNVIKNQLFQIKRRYILTINNLLNDYFYENSEAEDTHFSLKKENIVKRISATYDLRSRFLHDGVSFGHWIIPHGDRNNETNIGTPFTSSKELSELLYHSPTFVGFERIIRFCLLRFIHLNSFPIDKKLDN